MAMCESMWVYKPIRGIGQYQPGRDSGSEEFFQPFCYLVTGFLGKPMTTIGKVLNYLCSEAFSKMFGDIWIMTSP